MSISSVSNIAAITNIRKQLDIELEKVSSGKKSTSLSGYGSDAKNIIDLRSSLSSNVAYTNNAQRFISKRKALETTLNTMGRMIEDVTKEGTQNKNTDDYSILKKFASEALQQFGDLMGSKYDGQYLYGETAPVTNKGVADYKTAIGQRMQDLKDGVPAENIIALTKNATDTVLYEEGYKPSPNTPTSTGVQSNFGVDATAEGFKNVFRGLATLANIPDNISGVGSEETRKVIDEAVTALKEGNAFINTQNGISAVRTTSVQSKLDHNTQMSAIQEQRLADIENANVDEALVKAKALENTLMLSYNVLATRQKMSLVNFLN